MAVMGITAFKERFKDYDDCYTIIGGTACDILMAEEELDFRATKDIDMIILLEDRYREFAEVFWAFIKEGGYRCGWKRSDKAHFYRFTEPRTGYPVQIELFSRKPDYHLEIESGVVPIYIDDDVSSLSAIMLNDDFYSFMMDGRKSINGISVLCAEHIIPFKMYAWLNLKEQKRVGEHVNSKDLRKHKYDVFRLLQIVPAGAKVKTTGAVKDTINSFLSCIQEENLNIDSLGVEFSQDQGIELLRQIYQIQI